MSTELKPPPIITQLNRLEQEIFRLRINQHWENTLRPLQKLYGKREDFAAILDNMLQIIAEAYVNRNPELRLLDLKRLEEPDWFQQSKMVGYIAYADRFAEALAHIPDKIPYLQELGVTYLHLMPLLQPRPGENDGGYAVQNYRQVDSRLGRMADLKETTIALRNAGISLCTDLVMNHTAKEHEWAQKALVGDKTYQDYYIMFPNREMPNQYEKSLPEIFPDFAPGNFTYCDQIDKWVWTTFNAYQWDLNWKNPAVFAEMLAIMLYLANQGVEILRLDAVAFTWKRLGTDSQNQPEAHAILQALRALIRIAAPAIILKAEAIVSPPNLLPYLGEGIAANKECEIAYHNVLMVTLWSALAERNVRLMTYVLGNMPGIPNQTAWITYVRCHDDIGWAITEEDAAGVGLNGFAHRAFLSDFYSGNFPGSFAAGSVFQFNPKTGDQRMNGSCASLAGLEKALEAGNEYQVHLAIQRILLIHSLIFAFGGIPLIYMGDEIGMLNDYDYVDDPAHADDSRWLHRPKMDWEAATQRNDDQTIPGKIFRGLQQLIKTRQRLPALHSQANSIPVWTHNDHVFGLMRQSPRGRMLILANFSEQAQSISGKRLTELGFAGKLIDQINLESIYADRSVLLRPYQTVWLTP